MSAAQQGGDGSSVEQGSGSSSDTTEERIEVPPILIVHSAGGEGGSSSSLSGGVASGPGPGYELVEMLATTSTSSVYLDTLGNWSVSRVPIVTIPAVAGAAVPVAGPSSSSMSTSTTTTEPKKTGEIKGFKVTVDENGEEIVEFASDIEEEEEQPEIINVQIPMFMIRPPTFMPQLPPAATTPQEAEVVDVDRDDINANNNEYNNQLQAIRGAWARNWTARRVYQVPIAESSSDDEGPPDLVNPTIQRVVRPATPRPTPRPKRKYPGRTKKKKLSDTPSKPLVPKTIINEADGNETAKWYRSELKRQRRQMWIGNSVNVNFNTHDTDTEEFIKVRDLNSVIEDDPLDPTSACELFRPIADVEQLQQKFENLQKLTFYPSGFSNKGLLELVTENELSEEEAAQQPVPKLTKLDQRRKLIFRIKKFYIFYCSVEGFDIELFSRKGLGNRNAFRLDFAGFNEDLGRLQFNILLRNSFVVDYPSIHHIPYIVNQVLSKTFDSLFNLAPVTLEEDSATSVRKEDVAWFYSQIKEYHAKEVLPPQPLELQPERLGPHLREYQRSALQWMLFREGTYGNDILAELESKLSKAFMDKIFKTVMIGGKQAFYNQWLGLLSWNPPSLSTIQSGGILADEMGLGKTVEVISLTLLNPRPTPLGSCRELEDDVSDADSSIEMEVAHEGQKWKKRARKLAIQSDSEQSDTSIVDAITDDEDEDYSPEVKHDLSLSKKPSCSPPTKRFKRIECDEASETETESEEQENVEQESTSSSSTVKRKKISGIRERLTYTYHEELGRYSEAGNYPKPVHHGQFYNTTLLPRKGVHFYCPCGVGSSKGEIQKMRNERKRIVVCGGCGTYQHADCVRFNVKLEEKFKRRGTPYLCPHCTAQCKPVPGKGTLIVTPATISHQWIEEIRRHIKQCPMNVLFYEGVTSHHGYIHPEDLADYDVVITTYSVLSNELHFVDISNATDKFRKLQRFMALPSPITGVSWWRVCLDEAQMVEGVTTRMALMVRKLDAVHRWCVTGTPINTGLEDLFGLFAFLGVEPISLSFWWQKLVQDTFQSRNEISLLQELFGQLIWRTNKADVLDQLNIPIQTSISKWLTFSAVEAHFYKQQYEICSKNILEKIFRLQQTNPNILCTKISDLDRQNWQSLLLPFLELRKACCHPQIVKGQSICLSKGTLTMEDLLSQLIKKSRLECAEDHRQMVAALNGMAGIYMLKEEWLTASEKYREVLQSAATNKEHFSTDSLQLLHTLDNLADLLDRHHDGIPYTLRDGTLRSEAEELKTKYLANYQNGVQSALLVVKPLTEQAEEISQKFLCTNESWWGLTLNKAAKLGKIEDLVKRIKDELLGEKLKKQRGINVISMANKFNESSGLQFLLIEQIQKIEKLRKSALDGLEKLQTDNPSVYVDAAVSCHLRKKSEHYYKDSDDTGYRCQLCRYHDQFLDYESVLFREDKTEKVVRTGRVWQQKKLMGPINSEELTEEERNLVLLKEEEELLESLEHVNIAISEQRRHGTWGDSETEKVLKIIKTFARINGLPRPVRDDGNTHIKLFEAMKKEFRFLRILWMKIYDQISAFDELSQATTRLCLRHEPPRPLPSAASSSEPQPSTSTGSGRRKKKTPKELAPTQLEHDQRIQNLNVLDRHELEPKMTQIQIEFETGKQELSKHFGQLLYLQTLKKKNYTGEVNTEDCPVCQIQLGEEWNVLPCGHSFCSSCVKQMCPNLQQNFLCPLCRQPIKYRDINFVDNRQSSQESSAPSHSKKKHIKGSHSTKVEGILECVMELQETHPGEKLIIFSSWVDVLEIISKALTQNDAMNCLLTSSGKKFTTDLQKFKTIEDIQVLLMPLSSGSKGLNIIEATHVLLVEPILNLASELQAIGRIHRIGQTKPTFVHRFYIKNTIEEQLFEILKGYEATSDSEGALTVESLQKLISSGKDFKGSTEEIASTSTAIEEVQLE